MQQLGAMMTRYTCLAFTPDGRGLVAGTDDGTIHGWRTADGHPYQVAAWQGVSIASVAFRPDGHILAVGRANGSVTFWQEAHTYSHHAPIRTEEQLDLLVYSPDGQYLAAGNTAGGVTLWQVATQRPLNDFNDYYGGVTSVQFTADGQTLVLATRNGPLWLGEGTSGRLYRTLDELSAQTVGRAQVVACSSDGAWLASGREDGVVQVWRLGDGRLHQLGRHDCAVTALTFAPDGRRLVSGSSDGFVRVWEVVTGRQAHALPTECGVASLQFLPQGEAVRGLGQDGTVWTWTPLSGERRIAAAPSLCWPGLGRGSVVWAAGGTAVAVCGADSRVRWWVAPPSPA